MKSIVLHISELDFEKFRFEAIEQGKSVADCLRDRIFHKPFSKEVLESFDRYFEKEFNKMISKEADL